MGNHSGTYSKRDSGLSMATTPPLTAQKNPPALPSSAVTGGPIPPAKLPRPAGSANPPPLSLQTQPRDRRESSLGFSLPNSRPVTRGGSVESEVDPLLPPLKRSRVGHSRLQSIGELQLLRDNDPCLRCKVLHKAVRALPTISGIHLEQTNRFPVRLETTMHFLLGTRTFRARRALETFGLLPRLHCVVCGCVPSR